MSVHWLQSTMGIGFIVIWVIVAQIVIAARRRREYDEIPTDFPQFNPEPGTSLKPTKAA